MVIRRSGRDQDASSLGPPLVNALGIRASDQPRQMEEWCLSDLTPLSGRILNTPEVSRDGIVVAVRSRDGQKPVLRQSRSLETRIYGSITG